MMPYTSSLLPRVGSWWRFSERPSDDPIRIRSVVEPNQQTSEHREIFGLRRRIQFGAVIILRTTSRRKLIQLNLTLQIQPARLTNRHTSTRLRSSAHRREYGSDQPGLGVDSEGSLLRCSAPQRCQVAPSTTGWAAVTPRAEPSNDRGGG